ncbi:MAG: 23S rRNA (uracil(1939)-C(5))-methyltransferase RlmD [Oscillospiraceae bacterium]|nr:23S rRNA (uracil(1939)-C(5))-methyltransferase RlmD [Oscillospiraceae bacterium]
MLIKNQVYEAEICDYTAEGQGIAKVEGCAVFIPNAVRGERVRVRIEKAQKTWASGKIVEILEKSPHRVNRECPVAKLCGGCDFWHMDYEEETRLKAERVRSCLNRIGGEKLENVPILSAPTCYGYRNKAQYPVSSHKGRAFAGFFKAGTHSVVENDSCRILPEEMDQVKDIVIAHMNRFRIPAYDETAHTGLVRHIYVRRGAVSKQVLVCLAVNGRKLPHAPELIESLKKVPGFTTLVLSVNTKKGNTILGDEFITLYGPGTIEDTLCGLVFRLSPRSFYQVNHHQAQRLYQAAIEQAGITKADTVLDLYCGVGTITLAMAGAAGKVIGVEVIEQAVEDAKENAKRNGIDNAEFFCGDAGAAALELEKQGVKADVVVVDPPRKGLNADTIEALSRFAPRRIVYVSCDPATLARDVALLKERGYVLKNAMAADLFPRCTHVESVVCMVREQVIHSMKLHDAPFQKIKSGEKTIELRLFDEKRQKIHPGDQIVFTNNATGETLTKTVAKLHRFDSFEALYQVLPLLQCGYTAEDIDTASPSDMEQYYSAEEQKMYGVVGIELC